MEWPPIKSWTKSEEQNEYRYFVAINYGGEGDNRWINFVSVLNSNILLRVYWEEFNDKSKWNYGWIDLKHKNQKQIGVPKANTPHLTDRNKLACLHPSEDSGLKITNKSSSIRNWH
tara:strand:+ start:938 stop:1285 length:348 start_codon:yes stop_codon:yes gene_type:complete